MKNQNPMFIKYKKKIVNLNQVKKIYPSGGDIIIEWLDDSEPYKMAFGKITVAEKKFEEYVEFINKNDLLYDFWSPDN